MVVRLSDYIVSPLGLGTRATYEAVKQGKTRLRRYEGRWGVPQPFVASLFDEGEIETMCEGMATAGYSRFERLCILAVRGALQDADIDVRSPRTLFILSTTKGDLYRPLSTTAMRIAQWFGNPVVPLVVCNACISGLHALVEARRTLTSGEYDHVVVVGADLQSDFTVNGFYSLKALSPEPCRPFDEDRMGLNLGDAAACMVLGCDVSRAQWQLVRGAVRNDAYHLSSPSKNAEGYYQALSAVMGGLSSADIAFVNLHGTATLYNDEMESVGLTRAGLATVPAGSLKGYLGHTMGAAGLIETLLCMQSLDDGIVLGTRGYEHAGTSRLLNLSSQHRSVVGRRFVKTISGFGGGNAAMMFEKM
ncbi:MAG: beta-ketoacyl synthase [Bacteroidaceae bacterium]|nr:beta-ketoacyl synthase [Bacteroidaceae bacterium]